ncbi:MAG TPA: L-threonylcarbamoyladenylate synthase [Polyangiaceae bacterium]
MVNAVALGVLRSAGVVAAASESFFGLFADVAEPLALDRLLSLKPRGADQGMPVVLPSAAEWPSLVVEVPPLARLLGSHFWPGPLSIALAARPTVDPRLPLDGRLAVRVPGPCAAADLVAAFGRPLTATSANPPSLPPPTTSDAVRRAFPAVDWLYVVDGESAGGAPSTVLVENRERFRVARRGAVPVAALRELIGSALDESEA